VVGLLPLIPFLIPNLPADTLFLASAVAAGFAFFAVGAAKGIVLDRPVLRAGIETLLTGGGAALLAFLVGSWLQAAFGVA
jgi:VIT1/CCC1 family predicted Fe2+/Mn2+ transporter